MDNPERERTTTPYNLHMLLMYTYTHVHTLNPGYEVTVKGVGP